MFKFMNKPKGVNIFETNNTLSKRTDKAITRIIGISKTIAERPTDTVCVNRRTKLLQRKVLRHLSINFPYLSVC